MANILFLAHRIPYPPNKGDKIRSWHFLAHLLEHHKVHLGFFVDDKKDLECIPFLEGRAQSLCYQEVNKSLQKVRSFKGLVSGLPLTLAAYSYKHLRSYARNLIQSGDIDLVFLFSAATGPIVEGLEAKPVLTDLVDVDSEKWGAYADQSSWPMSWIYGREARLLAQYEHGLSRKSTATLLVSEQEADLFRSKIKVNNENIYAVSNGVDLGRFTPATSGASNNRRVVLFTGAMDYQPNVEAVVWFCEHVWPTIKETDEKLVFRIAGGPVAPAVQNLSSIERVEVAGYVPDMADEIAEATVCIAPLLTARGIQNKVLEAMAMAKPVVASSLANEGINACDDEAIVIADNPVEFAKKINDLLLDDQKRQQIGKKARAYVETHFTWQQAYAKLDAIIEEMV